MSAMTFKVGARAKQMKETIFLEALMAKKL